MAKLNKKPLIIWDFDGVIADSEKLWVRVWHNVLAQEKGIVLTKAEEQNWLMGMADRTKKHNIQKHFPEVQLDADFMQKITDGEIKFGTQFMQPMPGVQDVLADKHFNHCIATGATKEQQLWKVRIFPWLKNYVKPNDCFTVDMVEHGKPAPDLFLLALKTKGYPAAQAVVIEDSVHGMDAAKAAGIKCIAFVGAEGNNTAAYRKKCLDAGAIAVCANMSQLKQTLYKLFQIKQ